MLYTRDELADYATYNQAYHWTCMVIEQAFSQLKMWFCYMHFMGSYRIMHPLTITKLFAVCVMLHNMPMSLIAEVLEGS